MSEKFWGRLGRFADGLGVGQALAGWSAFGTAVAAVSGYAAYAIEWVRAEGWGAAFFVGVATACVLMFFASLGMIALGFLKSRAAPAAALLHPAQAPAISATPPGGGSDELAREVAALREDVDRALDAIQHNAKAMREGDEAGLQKLRGEIGAVARIIQDGDAARFENIRKTTEHALDEAKRKQQGLEAWLKDELAATERRADDRAKALMDGSVAQSVRVDEDLRSLRADLGRLREDLERRFMVRDAARHLRPLFARLRPLAARLIRADRAGFPDGAAWRAEYETWRADTEEFWGMASFLAPPGIEPFANSEEELESVRGVPEDERFADYEVQRRWRVLMVTHVRHGQHAGQALARIEAEASGDEA